MSNNKKAHTDQKYIQALLHNNSSLIEEIYKKFSGKIIRMVTRNSGSESDAGDVFQDALMAICTRAQKGDFILTCPFEAYLYKICHSKWMNVLNKNKRAGVTNLEDDEYKGVADDAFAIAASTLQQENREKLFTDKVKELSARCRQILQLSWSGKGMNIVAEEMGVTYGFARKKKSECMKKLVHLVQTASIFEDLKD